MSITNNRMEFTNFESYLFSETGLDPPLYFSGGWFSMKMMYQDQPGATEEIETYWRGNSYTLYKSDRTHQTLKSDTRKNTRDKTRKKQLNHL